MYSWIVLDGIEGTGKSTLCNYLAEAINGVVVSTNSSGDIAKSVRDRFKDKTKSVLSNDVNLVLMMASILETYHNDIIPKLEETYVISDRWVSSTYVYQVYNSSNIKSYLTSRKLFKLLTKQMLEKKPDLYIWCTCPIEIVNERVAKRGRNDRLDNLDNSIKENLIIGYESWYNKKYCENNFKLDCSKPLDEVKAELFEIVAQYFKQRLKMKEKTL
jgi:dTMP kinase